MSVTGYWARDMEYKLVYQDVATLLKEQCPLLHANYLKQLAGESASTLVPKESSKQLSMLPKEYLAKDIYKVSREIKKMQKLHANVLTVWYDVPTDNNSLSRKRQKLIGSKEY